jgi:hypothetical protein
MYWLSSAYSMLFHILICFYVELLFTFFHSVVFPWRKTKNYRMSENRGLCHYREKCYFIHIYLLITDILSYCSSIDKTQFGPWVLNNPWLQRGFWWIYSGESQCPEIGHRQLCVCIHWFEKFRLQICLSDIIGLNSEIARAMNQFLSQKAGRRDIVLLSGVSVSNPSLILIGRARAMRSHNYRGNIWLEMNLTRGRSRNIWWVKGEGNVHGKTRMSAVSARVDVCSQNRAKTSNE